MSLNMVASLEAELLSKHLLGRNAEISSLKTTGAEGEWKSSKLTNLFNLCNRDMKEATGHYYYQSAHSLKLV